MAPATASRRDDDRPASLSRRLAALAGAGGALVAGAEAEAVTYTPTAGVVAAQGIPGFSFVDASTVTLGALRGPATNGSDNWDPDGAGSQNFLLINSGTLFGRFGAFNSNSILCSSGGQLQNIASGGQVGAGQTSWKNGSFFFTYNGGNGAGGVLQNFSSTPGQFGFVFTEGANAHYGWGSLVIDGLSAGRGYKITEAYYQSAPGTAINVGQVPVAVPEPTGMALLAIGSAGVIAWRSCRKQPT